MSTSKTYKVAVPVLIVQEGKYYTAYCPALELSSYAKTQAGAKKAFAGALKIFLEETERRGTLEKELLALGWSLKQKPTFEYQPPSFSPDQFFPLKEKTVRVLSESVPIRKRTSRRMSGYAVSSN